jgi:hypothetical protein
MIAILVRLCANAVARSRFPAAGLEGGFPSWLKPSGRSAQQFPPLQLFDRGVQPVGYRHRTASRAQGRVRRALCRRDLTTGRFKFEGVGPAGLDGDHIGHPVFPQRRAGKIHLTFISSVYHRSQVRPKTCAEGQQGNALPLACDINRLEFECAWGKGKGNLAELTPRRFSHPRFLFSQWRAGDRERPSAD